MKTEFRKMTVPLLFCVIIFGLSGGAMALNVSFTKSVTASDNVYVAYLGNTITLNATVTPSISGEPDGEYTGTNETIEYRWFVDNSLTNETRNFIELCDGQHYISGYGSYTVRCEARYSISYSNGNEQIASYNSNWFTVGEKEVTFFILEFQKENGTVISSVTIAKDGTEKVRAVLHPSVSVSITLTKSDDGITATYTIPGIVQITGNTLGSYSLYASYRNQRVKTWNVEVANAYINLYFVP